MIIVNIGLLLVLAAYCYLLVRWDVRLRRQRKDLVEALQTLHLREKNFAREEYGLPPCKPRC